MYLVEIGYNKKRGVSKLDPRIFSVPDSVSRVEYTSRQQGDGPLLRRWSGRRGSGLPTATFRPQRGLIRILHPSLP